MSTIDLIKNALRPLIHPYSYIKETTDKVNWIAFDALIRNPQWFMQKAKDVYDLLPEVGECSDGYHTFNELYDHRMHLFAVICNQNGGWKSKLHHDGTMYDDYFIVGIKTPEGEYTYHYPMKHWDMFKVQELERAPEWDGHQPSDIIRLHSLNKED